MRAVTIAESGDPGVLEIREIDAPRIYPGAVRVKVAAMALNRADVLQRRGLYPAPRGVPDDVPGLEFAGRVAETGEGAERFEPGDRVMGLIGGGAQAEEVVVHERELMRVPDGLDFEAAAAIPEVFVTAWDALVLQAGLRRGERVLIHAVGSGVGTAALQIANLWGAETIGTSRTTTKLERAETLGLNHGVVCQNGAFEDATVEIVRSLAADDGVDVILDLVGGRYLSGNIRALREGGRMVTIGLLGGLDGRLDLATVLTRRLTLCGSTLRARPLEEKIELARGFEREVLPAFVTGELAPVIDRVMPVESVSDAHDLIERNATFGKVVLTWSG